MPFISRLVGCSCFTTAQYGGFVVYVSKLHSLVYVLSMFHSSTVRCFTVYRKVCRCVGFTTEHKVLCYPCFTDAQSGVYIVHASQQYSRRCFKVYIKVCSCVGFTTEQKVSCCACFTAAQSGVYIVHASQQYSKVLHSLQ